MNQGPNRDRPDRDEGEAREVDVDEESTSTDEGGGPGSEQRVEKVVDLPEEVAEPLHEVIDRRECRVLDAEALERLRELSEAIVRAENRARQIVEEARREAESIREAAREEGRREGYEELLPKIAGVRERYRQVQDEAEEDTLELAFRVAKRLVGREIDRDPSVIRDIVEGALERVRGKRHVVIRVHPDDVPELDAHTDELSEKLDGAAVYVEEDESIERGGCVVETESNRVDARLDLQLERLREVLVDA